MIEIVDETAFLQAPAGRAVAGRGFVYGAIAVAQDLLFFTLLRGAPDATDLEALARLWEVECKPPAHLSIFDAKDLAAVDAAAFSALGVVLTALYPRVHVSRQALVRPPGMMGALVAGHQYLVAPPYPIQLFESRAEALVWLGCPGEILDGVELGADELLVRLRARLEGDLSSSLADIAAELGVSERSLQRRLGAAQTSFMRELAAAQIRRATRLLDETGRKLSDIAGEVGLSSAGALIELFRRHTGLTPQQWRDRLRSS